MNFFYIQKSDRNAILGLLFVIGAAMLTYWMAGGRNEAGTGLKNDTTVQDSTHKKVRQQRRWKNSHQTVKYIYRYRNRPERHGRHNNKDSFPVPPTRRVFPHLSDTSAYPRKIKVGEHIDLNTTDTIRLRSVPGIGPYFAAQIVRYRKYLGGYVSVDQLDEITDFPAEAKPYFEIKDAHPQRININKLTLQELRRHPYINYYQARSIVDYRRLHGHINSLEDLSLSRDFTPEAIRRLEPYVEY